jgi:hypothetical protein
MLFYLTILPNENKIVFLGPVGGPDPNTKVYIAYIIPLKSL